MPITVVFSDSSSSSIFSSSMLETGGIMENCGPAHIHGKNHVVIGRRWLLYIGACTRALSSFRTTLLGRSRQRAHSPSSASTAASVETCVRKRAYHSGSDNRALERLEGVSRQLLPLQLPRSSERNPRCDSPHRPAQEAAAASPARGALPPCRPATCHHPTKH